MGDNLRDIAGFRWITTGPPNTHGLELTFLKTLDVLEADNLAAGRKRFQRLTDDRTDRVDCETLLIKMDDIFKPNGQLNTMTAIMAKLRSDMRSESSIDDRDEEAGTGSPNTPYPRFKINLRWLAPNEAEVVLGDTPADGQWPSQQPADISNPRSRARG